MTRPAGEPRATVLVPCYNARPYVRAAVESALVQDFRNYEVVVVDDGSDDGSLGALEGLDDPRLHIERRETNAGKPAVFNAAVEASLAAGSDYLCVLDADDLMAPERVRTLIERLEREPDLAAVFSGHELILDAWWGTWRGAPVAREKTPGDCRRDVEGFRLPGHDPTAMYRLRALGDLRMSEDLRIGQGLDLILRLGERAPMASVGAALYSYRVHRSSITKSGTLKRSEYVAEVIRRACERRGLDPAPEVAAYLERASKRFDGRIVSHLIDSAVDLREKGDRLGSLGVGLRSILLAPANTYYYKPAACAALPAGALKRLRKTQRQATPARASASAVTPERAGG